jgi:hypothetical protein
MRVPFPVAVILSIASAIKSRNETKEKEKAMKLTSDVKVGRVLSTTKMFLFYATYIGEGGDDLIRQRNLIRVFEEEEQEEMASVVALYRPDKFLREVVMETKIRSEVIIEE